MNHLERMTDTLLRRLTSTSTQHGDAKVGPLMRVCSVPPGELDREDIAWRAIRTALETAYALGREDASS